MNNKDNNGTKPIENNLAIAYLGSATKEQVAIEQSQKKLFERFAQKNNIHIATYIEDIPKSGIWK